MTNRTAWPTFASGDAFSASQANTYCRDNDLAYWVYTTAGDIAYATSNAALARLAIGAAGTVLASTGSAPSWTTAVTGLMNPHSNVADFAPSQTFSSTWADITGATTTLGLVAVSTILVLACVTGNSNLAGSGRKFSIRAVVNGAADPNATYIGNGSSNPTRLEDLAYVYVATPIPAGNIVVKLQCQADTDSCFVSSGRLIALAFIG